MLFFYEEYELTCDNCQIVRQHVIPKVPLYKSTPAYPISSKFTYSETSIKEHPLISERISEWNIVRPLLFIYRGFTVNGTSWYRLIFFQLKWKSHWFRARYHNRIHEFFLLWNSFFNFHVEFKQMVSATMIKKGKKPRFIDELKQLIK